MSFLWENRVNGNEETTGELARDKSNECRRQMIGAIVNVMVEEQVGHRRRYRGARVIVEKKNTALEGAHDDRKTCQEGRNRDWSGKAQTKTQHRTETKAKRSGQCQNIQRLRHIGKIKKVFLLPIFQREWKYDEAWIEHSRKALKCTVCNNKRMENWFKKACRTDRTNPRGNRATNKQNREGVE